MARVGSGRSTHLDNLIELFRSQHESRRAREVGRTVAHARRPHRLPFASSELQDLRALLLGLGREDDERRALEAEAPVDEFRLRR